MKKYLLIITILFLISLSLLPQSVLAIAQVTTPLVLDNARRGQIFEKQIPILNVEKYGVIFNLETKGEIKDWLSFYQLDDLNAPITSLTLPANTNKLIMVRFIIPSDASNGEHQGEIVFNLKSAAGNQEESGLNINQSLSRPVSVNIIDKDIISLRTDAYPVEYIIKLGDTLKVITNIYNESNISIKPDIAFSVFKDNNKIFNVIYPYPDSLEAIKPISNKEMPVIEWLTTNQAPGDYQANVKIILADKIINEHNFTFTISDNKDEAENIISANQPKSGFSFNDFLSKLNLTGNWTIIIWALFIILLVILLIRRR